MRAEDLKVAAVLLAAGLSRRMGVRNKLLIEIGGEPLVRRTARVYIAAGVEVRAVLGHDADEVRVALAGVPVSFVTNPHYEEGQQSSVRAGIDSLEGGYDAILVALADQPALTAADILSLLHAFVRAGGNRIIVPYSGDARGNPVVFPASLIAEMRAAGRNAACRSFIGNNPQLTERYEAGHNRFILDIDTPDDLALFENGYQSGAAKLN